MQQRKVTQFEIQRCQASENENCGLQGYDAMYPGRGDTFLQNVGNHIYGVTIQRPQYQILQFYIFRLHILMHQGVLINTATIPIRQYLRK